MYRTKTITLILALISTIALPAITPIVNNNNISYTNSITLLLLFSVLVFFYNRIVEQGNRKLYSISVILGFIFSSFLVLGTNIEKYDNIYFTSLKTWLKVIANVPLLTFILVFIFNLVPAKEYQFNNIMHAIDKKVTWKLDWVLIFLSWVPILMATYPANYVYDAGNQLQNFIITGGYDLHHPLIHSVILVFFVLEIGRKILHSIRLGLLLYSLFQMLIFSLSLALIIKYLKDKQVVCMYRILILLLFMFSPFISLLAISPTKNILYTAFMIFTVLLYLAIIDHPKRWKNWEYITMFVLCSFINIIFENQGIYVFLAAIIFTFLFDRQNFRHLVVYTIAVLSLFALYNGPITNYMGGYSNVNDKTVEKLSVPIMQLLAVRNNTNADLSRRESKLIKKYTPNYANYNKGLQSCSDYYKSAFNTNFYKKDPKKFWKLWLSVGLNNINDYINAFGKMTMGYWYPDMLFPDKKSGKYLIEYYNFINPIHKRDQLWFKIHVEPLPGFHRLNLILSYFAKNISTQHIVILAPLLSMGFSIWTLIIFFAWSLFNKQRKYLFIIFLLLANLGTLFLGPVSLYRYALPFVVFAPLFIGIIISRSSYDITE